VVYSPAHAGRPRFDIADIVRAHRAQLDAEHHVSAAQRRVLSDIERCRTAALGGHLDVCRSCGHEHPSYNSCGNRHCPKCQALAQEKWIAALRLKLLPVRHFHVVFTAPSELRPLARRFPRLLYDTLLRTAGETLLDLGRSRLDGTLGATAVLHTWTRDLRFHPHVHALVTAGALAGNAWNAASTKYLFPVKVMGTLLRGKVIHALRAVHERGDLGAIDGFEPLISQLARANWVVYAKKPFRRVEHIVEYLGRYTHRVGIANGRLLDVTDTAVVFRTKHGKAATLPPQQFLRRLIQHVLPPGLKKIRHYGLYAAASSNALASARAALIPAASAATPTPPPDAPRLTWPEHLMALTGRDVSRCPKCGGPIVRLELPRQSRGPPARCAA
jgi:hypothetical protein